MAAEVITSRHSSSDVLENFNEESSSVVSGPESPKSPRALDDKLGVSIFFEADKFDSSSEIWSIDTPGPTPSILSEIDWEDFDETDFDDAQEETSSQRRKIAHSTSSSPPASLSSSVLVCPSAGRRASEGEGSHLQSSLGDCLSLLSSEAATRPEDQQEVASGMKGSVASSVKEVQRVAVQEHPLLGTSRDGIDVHARSYGNSDRRNSINRTSSRDSVHSHHEPGSRSACRRGEKPPLPTGNRAAREVYKRMDENQMKNERQRTISARLLFMDARKRKRWSLRILARIKGGKTELKAAESDFLIEDLQTKEAFVVSSKSFRGIDEIEKKFNSPHFRVSLLPKRPDEMPQ